MPILRHRRVFFAPIDAALIAALSSFGANPFAARLFGAVWRSRRAPSVCMRQTGGTRPARQPTPMTNSRWNNAGAKCRRRAPHRGVLTAATQTERKRPRRSRCRKGRCRQLSLRALTVNTSTEDSADSEGRWRRCIGRKCK